MSPRLDVRRPPPLRGALWIGVCALLGACGAVPDEGGGTTPATTDPPEGSSTPIDPGECLSIKQVQDPANAVAYGTMVKLCDVIVTGVTGKGPFFAGDPEGGAYTGIYVYQPSGATYIPSNIAVGDKVEIQGEFSAYFGANQIALFDGKEPPVSVTIKSSDNPLPPPAAIADPASIATPCDVVTSGAEASKYEGVRVALSNVEVTNLDPCGQGAYGVFEVASSLYVDDDLGRNYEPDLGENLTSVVGVLHYSFDHYRVFPGPGDVEGEGGNQTTETPTPEPGTPLPDGTCQDIVTLQNPDAENHPSLNSPARVCDVIVTGKDKNGLFVQEPEGGPWSGIYVFDGPKLLLDEAQPGDVVTLSGTLTQYFGTAQIALGDGSEAEISDTGEPLPPAEDVVDPTRIATPCDGTDGPDALMYEAVRVVIGPVEVTDLDPCGQGQYGVFEVDNSLYVDDDLGMDYVPEEGATLESVTGVLHRTFEAYRIFPAEGEVVEGEGGTDPTPTPGEETDTPDGPTVTPSPALDCVPIKNLRNPESEVHPDGDAVARLCDVLVSARDGTRGIYVTDRDGGPWSGIYVFGVNGVAPRDLAVGEAVNITGTYGDFNGIDQMDVTGNEGEITKTGGTGDLPAPVEISDLASIASTCDGADGAAALQYEGSLIKVTNVTVTDLDPCEQGSFGAFELADVLMADNDLGMDYEPTVGDVLGSVTGVLHHAFDFFRIYPRAGDVVVEFEATPGPTPTPGEEPTDPPVGECVLISEIQNTDAVGHPDADSVVGVCEAVVTAVQQVKNSSGEIFAVNFWIQEPGATSEPFSGIYVFDSKNTTPKALAVGDHVKVRGTYVEYFDLSEITLGTGMQVEIVSSGNPVPAPAAVAAADIASAYGGAECAVTGSGSSSEAYEGVLVKVSDLTITAVAPVCGDGKSDYEAENQLWIDKTLYDIAAKVDDRFDLTGVLTFRFGHFRVVPRSESDAVKLAE